jgi:hypothetical protein
MTQNAPVDSPVAMQHQRLGPGHEVPYDYLPIVTARGQQCTPPVELGNARKGTCAPSGEPAGLSGTKARFATFSRSKARLHFVAHLARTRSSQAAQGKVCARSGRGARGSSLKGAGRHPALLHSSPTPSNQVPRQPELTKSHSTKPTRAHREHISVERDAVSW